MGHDGAWTHPSKNSSMRKFVPPLLSIVTNLISFYFIVVAWGLISAPLASDVMSYIKRTSVSTIDVLPILVSHILLLAIVIILAA
jgi:hypothetical protein